MNEEPSEYLTLEPPVASDEDVERLRQLRSTPEFQEALKVAQESHNRKARRKSGRNEAPKHGYGSMAVPKAKGRPR